MGTSVLLVDYENVQTLDLSIIQEQELQIKIFVGQSQSKLPLELVQAAQLFGDAIEWIKIEGKGNNSLDFHIAFYLGQLSQVNPKLSFTVLSKDKGYDPLIRYLCNRKISCRRIECVKALSQQNNGSSRQEKIMMQVIAKLSKIEDKCRPRSRNALSQHVQSIMRPHKVNQQELDSVINDLFLQGKVAEVNNRITYNF